MNWFVWNYMNLVVNVFYILLKLSPSMSTALSDIRQTFLMNLAISTVTLILDWSVSVLRVILPCILWLSNPSGLLYQKLCMSFVCCFPSWVWNDPFQTRTHFHFPLPSKCWNLFYKFYISHTLASDKVILPLCDIAIKELPYDPLLGLLHQMVWALIGTSY